MQSQPSPVLPLKDYQLNIQGMHCTGCIEHVRMALRTVPGVMEVTISDWKTGLASVTTKATVDPQVLVQAIIAVGYQAEVVPPQKPMKKKTEPKGLPTEFDLIVIGTGAGGMGAALQAADLKKKVLIIEKGTIGGTCVNIGCVPSKTLIRAADRYHKARINPFDGINLHVGGVDWPALVHQKDSLVSELRQKKYVDILNAHADFLTLIQGTAQIQPGGVEVEGTMYTAPRTIVATGARPHILSLEGIDQVNVLTSTTLLALKHQPRSLIVIGGRAIALELGQALARLGTRVTILQRSERLLPEHEPLLANQLQVHLEEEGLEIITGVTPRSIREQGKQKTVTVRDQSGVEREFSADEILMAVGRTPNVEELGLEELGVELDESDFIMVNEYLQTSNPNIFAVGDVTTLPKLVYVAAKAGGLAARNALSPDADVSLDLTLLPQVIFTDPQVAIVGLTETQARQKGYQVQVSELTLDQVPRALAARDTRGVIKLVVDSTSDQLLGAHVLAAEGGELIQTTTLAVAMGNKYGFKISDMQDMFFPYLTQTEGLKLAATALHKDISQLSCCAG